MGKASQSFFKYLLVAAIITIINSCAPKQPIPPITIAANLWPGYDTFFMAETMEYYPEGSVHVVETPRSLALAQAIRGASIDAAAMSLSRAIELSDKEVDISIVLVLDSSHGADAIMAKPHIQSIKDLKGKQVAAEMDSISGYMFLRALEINDMTYDDVIMNNIDNREMAERYGRNELDAVAIYGYDRMRVTELGAHKLFDSSEIPGEIIDVLVVRNSYLEEYPSRVVDLLTGWIKMIRHLNSRSLGDPLPEGAMASRDYNEAIKGIKIWTPEENIQAFLHSEEKLQKIIDTNLQNGIKLGFVEDGITAPSINGKFLAMALEKMTSD